MLVSYADESGMHTNGLYPWVIFAGYVASEKQWKGFNKRWSKALKKYGLPNGFHMTDFQAANISPYSDWSDKERQANLDRFIRIIEHYKFQGFSFQLSWTDYNRVLSEPVRRKMIKHPYLALFDYAIRSLLNRLYWLPSTLKKERLLMVFGQTAFSGKAAYRYELIRQKHVAGKYLVAPPIFKSAADKNFLPLQASDILANVTRAFVRNKFH
jgi:hypothetical protein